MSSIADNTKAIMNRHDFTASKRFGQNFLRDVSVLEDIVKASGISEDDIAVEIGPGLGTLTEFLSNACARVYAIEVDKKLIPILRETLSGRDNIEIINADIMKTDLSAVTGGKPFRIVANLPYYITTPVIMSIFESQTLCRSVTVMVQKEVGERITAKPGSKNYGALTLAAAYHSKACIVRKVPSGCFVPAPKVDSVVVHMEVYEDKPVQARDEKLLFDLIRGAFNQRRKTLVNALLGYAGIGFGKEELLGSITALGLKPTVRGEELSLEQFVALADILTQDRE